MEKYANDASRLCNTCGKFRIIVPLVPGKKGNLREKQRIHDDLLALKNCAESQRCALCYLLWAGVQKKTNPERIKGFLQNWPKDCRLFIVDSKDIRFTTMFPLSLEVAPEEVKGVKGETIAELHITVESGNTEGRMIRTRFSELHQFTDRSPTYEPARQYLPQIRGWLDECKQGADRHRSDRSRRRRTYLSHRHQNCHPASSNALPDTMSDLKPTPHRKTELSPLPDRVIELMDGEGLRLINAQQGARGLYVALSYSWGRKNFPGDVIHELKLKKATEESLLAGIDRSMLTLAHAEAIQLTRDLGYRYIWIDALCIKQDDDDDWKAASHSVPGIYGNADLTILSGRSADSRHGFMDLKKWYSPAAPPVEVRIKYQDPNQQGEGSRCWVSLPRSREVGPGKFRAWCYQEALLSKRTVVFGQEQLMFNCHSFKQAENGFEAGQDQYNWFKYATRKKGKSMPTEETRLLILHEWYKVAGEYSKRQIHDPTDCFAALAGVARQFQRALGRPYAGYLAGLWDVDFVEGLMWISARLAVPKPKESHMLTLPMRIAKGSTTPEPAETAPSWSWLALVGPIIVPQIDFPSNKTTVPICFPAAAGGEKSCWTTEGRGWSMDKIKPEELKEMLPCPIVVRGSLRCVRLWDKPLLESKLKMDYRHVYRPFYLARKGVGLVTAEADDDNECDGFRTGNNGSRIFGAAFFDRADEIERLSGDQGATGKNPEDCKLWALATLGLDCGGSGEESKHRRYRPQKGLLLKEVSHKLFAYVRLGVFWVTEAEDFPGNDFSMSDTKIALIG